MTESRFSHLYQDPEITKSLAKSWKEKGERLTIGIVDPGTPPFPRNQFNYSGEGLPAEYKYVKEPSYFTEEDIARLKQLQGKAVEKPIFQAGEAIQES